jgi:hypothetical protein
MSKVSKVSEMSKVSKVLKMLFSVFIIGCMSAQAFAQSALLNVLHPQHAKMQDFLKKHKNKINKTPSYADFSGNWKGTCTSSDGETAEVFSDIYVDDFGVNFNGEQHDFTVMQSKIEANEFFYSTSQSKYYWDDTGRTLTEWFSSTDGQHAHNMYGQIGTVTYTLDNGDLIVKQNVYDSTTEQGEKMKCVLKKIY